MRDVASMRSEEYSRFIRRRSTKVFASFCQLSKSDAYVLAKCMRAGLNDGLASPKSGDETAPFYLGIVQLARWSRMPHGSTFGNHAGNRCSPNF